MESVQAIELHNLALGYAGRMLYEGVNLTLGKGEFTALIGRNGTGKSTLLRTLSGLVKPLSGTISILGSTLSHRTAREIASLISFVSTEEVRIGNLRVYDVVGLGRAPYTNWIGRLTNDDHAVVLEALRLVGMTHFAEKNMDTLSDGERQRVMIARSLAQDTPIILLDEPTAFLDLPNKYDIVLLLRRLAHEHGKTILFSTHDLNIALELCDTLVLIHKEKFAYGAPTDMMKRGEIQSIFIDTSLFFDPAVGMIRLREELK